VRSRRWRPADATAFLRTYFSEPELSLPSGTWRIDVTVHGNIGDGCTGPAVDLELALIVTVTE
jgi:hypothetical protein